MGKAINAFVSAAEVESDSTQGTKLTFLDFSIPKTGCREVFVKKKNNKSPHERVVTKIREVKYLRDGYVKEENTTRKIVLESFGYETVTEILMSRADLIEHYPEGFTSQEIVGQVVRDLRRKEESL